MAKNDIGRLLYSIQYWAVFIVGDVGDWIYGLIYLSPLLFILCLFVWAIRGIVRHKPPGSIVDRYLLGLSLACLCGGALVALIRAIGLASTFEYPGNALANILLPFVIALTPVVWVVLSRYRVSMAKASSVDFARSRRTIHAAGTAWLLVVVIAAGFAFSAWSPTTYSMTEYPELAKTLIKAGIAVNKRDYNGQTPLGMAIKAGDISLVRLLISQGADVNLEIIVRQARTSTKYKPLKLAAIYKYAEIAELLRQSGASE